MCSPTYTQKRQSSQVFDHKQTLLEHYGIFNDKGVNNKTLHRNTSIDVLSQSYKRACIVYTRGIFTVNQYVFDVELVLKYVLLCSN